MFAVKRHGLLDILIFCHILCGVQSSVTTRICSNSCFRVWSATGINTARDLVFLVWSALAELSTQVRRESSRGSYTHAQINDYLTPTGRNGVLVCVEDGRGQLPIEFLIWMLFAYDSIPVSSAWELISVPMCYSQGDGVNTPLPRLLYCSQVVFVPGSFLVPFLCVVIFRGTVVCYLGRKTVCSRD